MQRIPWENIELYFEGNVTLDPDKLITRYLTHNRGGLCYQLNMTLHYLLRYLGFSVELRAATIFGYLDKTYQAQRNSHILNVLHFKENKYIIDVGWGEIWGLLSIDNNNLFQMTVIDSHHYEFLVEYSSGAKNIPQYKVMREPLSQAQLQECTDYSVCNEEREVQHNLMCHKKITDDCSVLLVNDLVKIRNEDIILEKNIAEYGGVKPALKEFFDIIYT